MTLCFWTLRGCPPPSPQLTLARSALNAAQSQALPQASLRWVGDANPSLKPRRPEKVSSLPDAVRPGQGRTRRGLSCGQAWSVAASKQAQEGVPVDPSWDLVCSEDAVPVAMPKQDGRSGGGPRGWRGPRVSRGAQSRAEAQPGGWRGRVLVIYAPSASTKRKRTTGPARPR